MRNPQNVEGVFEDFKGRRIALIKALIVDADKLFNNCSGVKGNLSLCGYPDETWKVHLPVEMKLAGYPELALGANNFRDEASRKKQVSVVAFQSDYWLLNVALKLSALCGLGKSERGRLFQMINDLPSVSDIVNAPRETSKGQSVDHESNKTVLRERNTKIQIRERSRRLSSKQGIHKEIRHKTRGIFVPVIYSHQNFQPEKMPVTSIEEKENIKEQGEDAEDTIPCGSCGQHYGPDTFWIACDTCEAWFHGICVKVTCEEAKHIGEYKCPRCSKKRARVTRGRK